MPIAYSQVSPKIWDDRIRRCSPTAGRIRAYIATCPAKTSEGFFQLPLGYAATDTALPLHDVNSALEELHAAGIVGWDPVREIVLDYLALESLGLSKESDNRIKGAIKQLRGLGSTPLWEDFLRHAQNVAPSLFEAVIQSGLGSPAPRR